MGVKGFIHSVETFGTVDGPGTRYVFFMQGCPLRCKYCHNRDSWEMTGGKAVNSDTVLEEIRQYRHFYKPSGGGVTASGGEPTLQPDFVEAVFSGTREMGLNTALDTSGYVNGEEIKGLLGVTDLVILDIKELDEAAHLELTGASGKKTRRFAEVVGNLGIPIWVRHVLIPGITLEPQKIRRLGEYLKTVRGLKRVELLGFHKLGSHKWGLQGCPDPLENIAAASAKETESAKQTLRDMGIVNVV